ncbi:MAG: VCBS repeat-containing protein [Planctomycetes bacterium]|nr:VCBS repeat-containing protein [Planctomycetota bacterium]
MTTSRMRFRRLLACLAVVGLLAGNLVALINPKFTPSNLARQSGQILELDVSRPDKDGLMQVRILKSVKGQAPAELLIKAADAAVREQLVGDANDADSADKSLFGGHKVLPAVIFFGKPGGPAFLRLGKVWFNLAQADKVWEMRKDQQDLKAIWDGDTQMLARYMEYLAADPKAEVPSVPTGKWGKWEKLGPVAGNVCALVAADLSGKGHLTLLAASTGGDRAFRREDKGFADVTAELKLAGKSRLLAVGDFNADGRTDLACWDGKALDLFAQGPQGTFEVKTGSVELADCTGLTPLSWAAGPASLLAGTAGEPLLATVGKDGKLSAAPIVAKDAFAAARDKLGDARACVVADFDSDGQPDVLQPFVSGGLFYKGKGDGTFAGPASCGDVFSFFKDQRGAVGDFDADGELDVLFAGSGDGVLIWRNLGKGKFALIDQTQEATYSVRPGAVAVSVCDLNNDGWQDFVVFPARSTALPFYGRGFAAFGFETDMDFAKIEELTNGQRCGLAADLNGDGLTDTAMVLADGSVYLVYQAARDKTPPLLAELYVPTGSASAGPIKVVATDGNRRLGAWSVWAGGPPAVLAKKAPGEMKITVSLPGRPAWTGQAVLKDGPVRFLAGPEGLKEPAK